MYEYSTLYLNKNEWENNFGIKKLICYNNNRCYFDEYVNNNLIFHHEIKPKQQIYLLHHEIYKNQHVWMNNNEHHNANLMDVIKNLLHLLLDLFMVENVHLNHQN